MQVFRESGGLRLFPRAQQIPVEAFPPCEGFSVLVHVVEGLWGLRFRV